MNLTFLSIEPFSWFHLGSAFFAGTLIGLERQILGKPAGIRTSVLICMGTYTYVALVNSIGFEMDRIISQIVTGVGFLGGGVIVSREGMIQGMTSAAAIWVLASIGAVIGVGYAFTGVKLSIIVVLLLILLDRIELKFKIFRKGVHK